MLQVACDLDEGAACQRANYIRQGILIGWARIGHLNAAGLIADDDELNALLIPEGLDPTTDGDRTVLKRWQGADELAI